MHLFHCQLLLRKHHQINDSLFSELIKSSVILEYLWNLGFGKTMRLRPELDSCHFRHVEPNH